MFHVLLLVATLTNVINSYEFYSVNQEMPNRSPKILTLNGDSGPKIEDFYMNLEPAYENIPGSSQFNISADGLRVVNNICARLRQFQYFPVVLLLQDKENVLLGSDIYMNTILANPVVRSDFWLMKFNASGVSDIIAKSAQLETGEFTRKIYDRNRFTSQYLGPTNERAAAFFAVLRATRTLPPGSAILLFTDSQIEDEDLAPLAIREMRAKRIKLFAVWQGSYPTRYHEENLIRESCFETNGFFFIGNTERKSISNQNFMNTDSGKTNNIITHHSNVHGNKVFTIPIDDQVDGIHISITANVYRAQFTTPNGYLINLLNLTDITRFSQGSYVVKTGETFEIDLNTAQSSQATSIVGAWRLETDATSSFAQHYNITVSARTDLILETKLIDMNATQGYNNNKIFRIDVLGNVAKIDNVSIVHENGAVPLNYRIRENIKASDDIETIKGSNIDINVNDLPKTKSFVRVTGKDSRGNEFQRISYYNPNNIYNLIQPTTIELVDGSELLVTPNRASNLLFHVSNNRNQVILVHFQCRDEKRFLRWMQPRWAWINPHQKVVVTVSVITPPTPVGNRDVITFSAISGTERTEKSVILSVNNNALQYDNQSPHMWHTFTSDCLNVFLGRCEDHSWTVQVTAQDKETGLLSLTSSPEGLYFPHGYISGTTEEVTGTFSGSCCQSSIVLTAVDLTHNRRSYVADAYWTKLGVGAIAAVVLGVLFLIILIIVVVVCCRKGKCKCNCGKKDSDSFNVTRESYRGPHHSSSSKRF